MDYYRRFSRAALERGIPADQVSKFADQVRFAIWVSGGRGRDEDVVGQSGGLPSLPAATEWPSSGDGHPLPFIASLDCAALPRIEGLPLPADGSLLFFLDHESAFDAFCRGNDEREHARALYIPAGTDTAVVRHLPSGREIPGPYPEYQLFAAVAPELPSWLEPDEDEGNDPLEFASDTVKRLAGELTRAKELVALARGLWPAEGGLATLCIGGYTQGIGGSDPPETQMSSANLRARLKAEPNLARSEKIRWRREEEYRLIREWVPLAQFPTEGEVYYGRFLIRFDDLAAGRFDKMRSFTAFTE